VWPMTALIPGEYPGPRRMGQAIMSDVWIAVIPSAVAAVGALVVARIQLTGNAKNDEKIEALRAQLTQATNRRRTLFERRANVLASVYALLVDALEAFEDFLNSGTRWESSPGPQERQRIAVEAGEQFRKAFTRARILIPEELESLLDGLNREFVFIAREFNIGRSIGENEDTALMRAYKKTEGTIKTALQDVNKAFRQAISEP
jgi:hypothetical protein